MDDEQLLNLANCSIDLLEMLIDQYAAGYISRECFENQAKLKVQFLKEYVENSLLEDKKEQIKYLLEKFEDISF